MIRLSYIVLSRLNAFRSAEELRPIVETLRDAGYHGVEFNLTEPSGVDLTELHALVEQSGLVVPSFLTGEAYADGLCLSSPNEAIRRRAVERLIRYLDIARQFNAVLVVGLLQGLRRDEPDGDVANRRIAECLKAVADAATTKEVDLVIEPVNHLQVGFNNTVAEVRSLIASIGSPRVKPMVDTVHLNIEEHSLTQPILDCRGVLRHVHLCESNGGLFGTGHIDFAAVRDALERIAYDGFASVKVYRHATAEVAARTSIEHLRRIGFGR
jgi:sugar phosphate isomerase/epimerase